MAIFKTVSSIGELTEYTVKGTANINDFIAELIIFYSGGATRFVLWDLTEAVMWNFHAADMETMASYIARSGNDADTVKTAFVANDDHTRNLAGWFRQYSLVDGLLFDTEIFDSPDEAKQWFWGEYHLAS